MIRLSNTELAELVGLHPSTIRRWKTREIFMPTRHAQDIATELGLSPDSVSIWEQED